MAAKQKDKKDTRADKAISPQVVLAEVYKLQAAVENDYQSLTEPLKEDIEAHVHIQTAWMEHSPLSLAGGVILSLMRALIAGKKTNIPLLTGMRQGEASFSYEQHVQTITGLAALDLIVTPKKAEMLDKHWAECKQIIAAGYGSAETIKLPEAPVEALFVNHYLRICEAAVDFYMANGSPSTPEEAKAMFETFVELYLSWIPELQMLGHLTSVIPTNHVLNPKSPAVARETLEHIALKRAELIEYPLDKVNSTIWGLLERDTAGQIMFRAEKAGSKKEINILYSIDFDALGEGVKITKRLMPYDKRVYIAVSALFNAGNSIITLTQIYYAMGYTGRPGSNDLERINASITKMLGANIYISNEQEAAAYKYDKFVYKGSLLPYEQVEAVANGQLVDAAIHLFREPPVITFAKQRKQVTSIDVKLLQSPISKTDGNLLIDDYLIERISRAKNGKQPRRILYKTLYEKAKITDKKQRQRAADKIKRYLEHYQKCGMITRYTMEADGITVYFTRKKGKPPGAITGAKIR